MVCLIQMTFFLLLACSIKSMSFEEVKSVIEAEGKKFLGPNNGVDLDKISKYLEDIKLNLSVGNEFVQVISSSSLVCRSCGAIFDHLKNSSYPIQYAVLRFVAINVCSLAKMFERNVCKGAIDEMMPFVIKSLKNGFFDKDLACPFFKLCPKVYREIDIKKLRNDILSDKPQNTTSASFFNETKRSKSGKTFFVLHVSDIHTDLEYQEGAPADCDEPICCRNESKATSARKAQKWGSLSSCDLPSQTFEQFVIFLQKLNIEFGLWTGDNTSHDIWHQSYKRNLENTKQITKDFMGRLNYTIYPCIGNHESFPVNVYDYFSDREQEFNNFFAKEWKNWIGETASETMKKYGFYSTVNQKFNLRVISLNTQACNDENWFLLRDQTDPGNMLKWLRSELYIAEELKQRVYIISHYQNNECLEKYAVIYDAILERFSHLIKGNFVGHSHGDGYSFVRDSNTSEIIGASLMTGSLTTYSNRNPSFRLIEIDENTLNPVNFYEYRLDLDTANKRNVTSLEWTNIYNFLDEYGIPDMSNEGYKIFVEKLRTDPDTISKVNFHYSSSFPKNNNTLLSNSSSVDLRAYCKSFNVPSQVNKCNNKKESLLDWFVDTISGPWRERITEP